jgi:sugar O-acyltransferase (sialic acid O-acetyltransferase NeuD family)
MATKDLIIIGGGGHTRSLIGVAEANGLTVRGLITSREELLGTDIFGVPVLCLEQTFALDTGEVTLVNGVGNHVRTGKPDLAPRTALYQRYKAKGYPFLPLISKSAIVQPHVIMGAGVQVMPGAILQAGCVIGENVIVNTRASVDHDVIIEPNCHIAPGAVICGNVTIGESTHVGAGAVIIDGIRIGKNVVIGAGALVVRDVADGATVRGKL